LTGLRQLVQLFLELTPPVALEYPAIRRRRAVERDALACGVRRLVVLLVSVAGDDEIGRGDLERRPLALGSSGPALQRRHGDLAQVPLRREGVHDQPVRDLSCHCGHRGTHCGYEHPGPTERVGRGGEGRRHQCVTVELAVETQWLTVKPAGP